MASGMAIEPMAGRDAYTAAKGGVVSLTRSMAVEYAPHNIRVNALAPGFTASERVKAQLPLLPQHQIEQLKRVNPLGLGEPENVAAFVALLASDEARYTSGQIFQVNNEMRGI
jgi:NAD(P)-dependent dehydrogenase (short-subunit alcohol dehydrogenase family)